jgi:hypothetical protein
MHKVLVDHKIIWRKWLRANTKGQWRVRFKTDQPDWYYFEEKEDADKFEAHVKEYVDNLKKEL